MRYIVWRWHTQDHLRVSEVNFFKVKEKAHTLARTHISQSCCKSPRGKRNGKNIRQQGQRRRMSNHEARGQPQRECQIFIASKKYHWGFTPFFYPPPLWLQITPGMERANLWKSSKFLQPLSPGMSAAGWRSLWCVKWLKGSGGRTYGWKRPHFLK